VLVVRKRSRTQFTDQVLVSRTSVCVDHDSNVRHSVQREQENNEIRVITSLRRSSNYVVRSKQMIVLREEVLARTRKL